MYDLESERALRRFFQIIFTMCKIRRAELEKLQSKC